ncbi:methyltransferase domain-containing protein [Corynebacterium bovis]|uniref:class I SAM-dependent methyltransferase n=1 Tax=Corynebacterium bovis TaxID=36808 RepID=UPI003138CE2E
MTDPHDHAHAHHHGHSHSHGHSHGQAHHGPADLLPALLDLDAVVHAPMISEATGIVAATAGRPGPVRSVVDLGAGTGTGTVALARRFPDAVVTAVDLSTEMLDAVRRRADEAGLSEQVRTVRADIGSDGLPVDAVDVVWASAMLHEVPDPRAALATLRSALAPGGVLAVVEMDAPPRLLPDDLEALESRLRDVTDAASPAYHPDWAPTLVDSGFTSVTTHPLTVDATYDPDSPGGAYAALELTRLVREGREALSDEDRRAFDTILSDRGSAASSLPRRLHGVDTVHVRSHRTLWTGLAPEQP